MLSMSCSPHSTGPKKESKSAEILKTKTWSSNFFAMQYTKIQMSTRTSWVERPTSQLHPLQWMPFRGHDTAPAAKRWKGQQKFTWIFVVRGVARVYIYIHINAYTYYMHIYIRNVCLYVKSTKYIISIYTHTWILLYTQIKYIICIYSNPSPKKTLGSHGPKGWVSPTS